jgi:hypothetical protein
MVSRRPLSFFATTFLCVAALVAPMSAAAAVKVFPTRIFVSEKFPAVHGALHSGSRFCAARRHLLVYRSRPGADPLVGRGWSHRSGAWKVPLGEKLERGHYYVVAPARSSGDLQIRCPAARSKSIPVE